MAVRRVLYAMGYRYRLHVKTLPGKPDIVFRRVRKVIMVHGCFWHSHKACVDGHRPRTNRGYWLPKLRRNRERDAKDLRELSQLGWDVLVVWGCEVEDTASLVPRLTTFLAWPVPSRRRPGTAID